MNRPSLGELLLGAYLRWTGKRPLLPLLKSLRHAGRPAEIAFPPELLEQGLSLVLAGLNNTLAMQSNPSWVWPHWVERQIDPDSESFLPTGTNVIKSNLTARNWTALGVPGSSREAMIDPVGMVTLRPYGWSWFPYLRADGADFHPPRLADVRQELLDGVLPVVVTRYAARPDLEWSLECMALRGAAGETGTRGGDRPEWLLGTHRLKNLSDRPLVLAFGVALRPYNPLMFSPVASIRHEAGGFRVNGHPALLLPAPPDRVVISKRMQGDPLLAHAARGEVPATADEAPKTRRTSNSGMLSAVAEYTLTLAPGEERVLQTVGLITDADEDDRSDPRAARREPCDVPSAAILTARRGAELERLRAADATGMRVEIPHEGLETAFRAVKARLHVFDDGDHFSPGTFLYHGHWFRDAAFIALAFDQIGRGDRVAATFEAGLRRQDRNGFFRSQNGEWDSNGQALWTLIGHVQRGGDPGLLKRAWPALRRGGAWIERTRRRGAAVPPPHRGLLPAGFSAEHFGPNDHYYWDNLWSLAGLEKLVWAARLLGRDDEAAAFATHLAAYRADVEASMDAAFRRTGGEGLPASPYRGMDSAAVGNLAGLSPLAVVSPRAEWVAGTVEHLARHNLRDGLFLQKIIHTGLNPYLSAQVARAFLVRQDPRAFTVLEALLRHGGPTHAWPEAIHPRTGGGCMGDGDHGWAAAEFLNLIRDFLVREERDALLLASGAPAAWFVPGNAVGTTGAPTLHGTVAWRVAVDEDSLTVEWSCVRRPHQDAARLLLCLPLAFARARGIPGIAHGPHLRVTLPGDSGRLFLETPAALRERDALSPFTGRMNHA